MRHSLYWDDFERRIKEMVSYGTSADWDYLPIRRTAVFITNKCNFYCQYCNIKERNRTLSLRKFFEVLDKYSDTSLIHITGGEPSVVPWLYPVIKEIGNDLRINLNTNAYIYPPAKSIQRLKISLDDYDANRWDALVDVKGAFKKVVNNIKRASEEAVTSVTYLLSKATYQRAIKFAEFAIKEFPSVYAFFFSVYKGTNPRFTLSEDDANILFDEVIPQLLQVLPAESKALLNETLDEKRRVIAGDRFEQDLDTPCFLSMSERVISPDGLEYTCSHLYRDGILNISNRKVPQCRYGCNQRLVQFNEEVRKRIYKKEKG